MKKIELENKIKNLETENSFFRTIIAKLLADQIKLKNKPRGKIKERIAVFTQSFRVKNLDCESLIFLPLINNIVYTVDNVLKVRQRKQGKKV